MNKTDGQQAPNLGEMDEQKVAHFLSELMLRLSPEKELGLTREPSERWDS